MKALPTTIETEDKVLVLHLLREHTLIKRTGLPVLDELAKCNESFIARIGKSLQMKVPECLMFLVRTLAGVADTKYVTGLVPEEIGSSRISVGEMGSEIGV